jgi:hypothetical protein
LQPLSLMYVVRASREWPILASFSHYFALDGPFSL